MIFRRNKKEIPKTPGKISLEIQALLEALAEPGWQFGPLSRHILWNPNFNWAIHQTDFYSDKRNYELKAADGPLRLPMTPTELAMVDQAFQNISSALQEKYDAECAVENKAKLRKLLIDEAH